MEHTQGEAVRKVVHVSTASSWRGGERQALFLASGLADEGFSSIAAVRRGSEMHIRCVENGIPVEPLPFMGEFDGFSMLRLAALLRKTQADIVHAHDAHGVSFASIAGWLQRVPAVATRRVDFPLRSVWKYKGLARLICISEAIRSICASAGLSPSEMPVVRSGIDTEWTRGIADDRNGVLQEFFPDGGVSYLLLNTASLVDHKGQKYLLEAMPAILEQFPDAGLVIAGEGLLRDSLTAQAEHLGIGKRVILAGFRLDVPRLLVACDIYIMSSHMEGLGTSLMDAMAAEKPVIATDAGGMKELLEDGVTGIQVPVCDSSALAHGVISLLSDTQKRQTLAKKAREKALAEFSIARMVSGTASVYRDILSDIDGKA
ncbi:hypothetical protein CSA37_12190 [Candidatus Fermentibacteria bacterium]|nr:MAG: hypothetical protein CSA37_12190 [Candidatus Fermentibacteria bacterium]